MTSTKSKNFHGGPGQQDPGRNRREDSPANDLGNGHGRQQLAPQAVTQPDSTPTETTSHQGLPGNEVPVSAPKQKKERQQWTQEQYKEIIWCYYYAMTTKADGGITKDTYTVWRARNPDIFPNINPNTLANQRRFIIKEKKLADVQLEQVKADVNNHLERIRIQEDRDNDLQPRETQTREDDHEMLPPYQPGAEANADNDDNEITKMINNITQKLQLVKTCEINKRKKLRKVAATKSTRKLITTANKALKKITQDKSLNITEINELMYATASVISGETRGGSEVMRPKRGEPYWKIRIQKTIEEYRKELGIIYEYKKGVTTQRVCSKFDALKRKYKEDLVTMEQVIKMKLQAKAQRLRRYTKRSDHYHQNKLFNEDPGKFYRQINNQKSEISEPPSQEHIENFWKGILEKDVSHNENATWIKEEKQRYQHVKMEAWQDLTIEDVNKVIKRTHNWKSPGPDKLPNFWIKQLTALHGSLTSAMNSIIKEPDNIPQWLTAGNTYLLSKGHDTKDPKYYRPITCLPTYYKILTAALSDRMYSYLITNTILPAEQKGCKKASRGCKDQLLVSKMVTSIARKYKRNLSLAWVDYKKAFDSVPHTWITTVMDLYGINLTIVNFVKAAMRTWRTQMSLFHSEGFIQTNEITIKRGIFQGDSLSPLLFCIALAPLTNMLNSERVGFEIDETHKVNHLFYMDDLKLFARDEAQLKRALVTVKQFSNDIGMEFGLDKCATAVYKRGKLFKSQNIQVDERTSIRNLENGEPYKYLGVDETDGIDNNSMKTKIRKEYYRRVRQVLNTELNAKNKIAAINALAVPIMTYSFGIVDWLKTEIEQIDRRTRKLLTMGGMHHPKADVDRLYIKRRNGGRGLIELQSAFEIAIVGLSDYLNLEKDKFCRMVKAHESTKAKYSIEKESENVKTKYYGQEGAPTHSKIQLRLRIERKKIDCLERKPLHGQFFKSLNKPAIDKEGSMGWLRSSGLKGETESLIIAAQDQALATRYYQKNVLKKPVDSKCRICHKAEEHVSHVIAGCSALAPSEYTQRHNKVAAYIHWTICKEIGLPVADKYYEHSPDKVAQHNNVVLLWDVPIITDRTILANRPDIVLHDKQKNTCLLIDISVPDDANIILKESEKISKYKDLEIEVNRMWNTRTKVVPIIVGALGSLKIGFNNYVDMLPGQPSKEEIQKIALLGTAHILRKVLG